MILKQSTAVILKMGPFVDSTDGVTAETGLTIAQADIQISKNGAAFAQTSDAAPTTTHDADGWYPIPLTTTDTGTLGHITIQVTMAGALPVWRDYEVVPANVYDSWVAGTDLLQTDLQEVDGSAPNAANLSTACGNYSATRGLAGTALPAAAADAAGGLPISDAGGLDLDTMDSNVAAVLVDTGTTLPGVLGTPAGADLATDIAAVKTDTAAILVDTGTTLETHLTDIKGAGWVDENLTTIDANVDAVLVDTGTTIPGVLGTPAGADLATDIAAVKTDTAAVLVDTGTTIPATLGTPADTDLATDIANVQTDTTAILEDTGTTLPAAIAALPDAAAINAEVDTALTDIHLDHLFAAAFNAAAKPGDANAFLNSMVEDDGGGSNNPQFTTKALENGPGGAASGRYEVMGDLVQDANGWLRWTAWLEFNGQPQETCTNCRISVFQCDADGTVTDLGTDQTVASPDSNGHLFNGYVEPTLESGTEYYVYVIIAYSGSDYDGYIPFKYPVRAVS